MAAEVERTHYQVLGVRSGAAPDEIRRAHRQLARVLHPDRQVDATPAERALAERRMREVNAAWTTLSDGDRRRDYDRRLSAARTGATGGAGGDDVRTGRSNPSGREERRDDDDPDLTAARARLDEVDPDEPELSAGHYWLLRRGPIVLVVLVGTVLFLVTAYAGGNATEVDSGQPPRTSVAPQNCVRLVEGRSAVRTSCEASNAGRIMTTVRQPLDCPDKTSYVILDDQVVCVTTDPSVTSNLPPASGEQDGG